MGGFLGEAIRWALRRARELELRSPPRPEASSVSPGEFTSALARGIKVRGYALILEYKRCRPGGFIEYREPEEYRDAILPYADGFSVLTEPRWFCGSPELVPVFASKRPVLFKDFVVSEVQVDYAAAWGASAVLLIAPALTSSELDALVDRALDYGLTPLIETWSGVEAAELARSYTSALIGINARNLVTLELSLDRLVEEVRRAKEEAPEAIVVAESGVSGPEDARRLVCAGADALLVGTAVMKDPSLAAKLAAVDVTCRAV